jgi:hypothetical protein
MWCRSTASSASSSCDRHWLADRYACSPSLLHPPASLAARAAAFADGPSCCCCFCTDCWPAVPRSCCGRLSGALCLCSEAAVDAARPAAGCRCLGGGDAERRAVLSGPPAARQSSEARRLAVSCSSDEQARCCRLWLSAAGPGEGLLYLAGGCLLRLLVLTAVAAPSSCWRSLPMLSVPAVLQGPDTSGPQDTRQLTPAAPVTPATAAAAGRTRAPAAAATPALARFTGGVLDRPLVC